MMIVLVIAVIFLFMCTMWLWYRYTDNPSVVDVGWAISITMAGLIYLLPSSWNSRQILIGIFLILWGLRLGGYLWYTRIRIGEVDKRYTKLSASWLISKKLGFFLNFQLQGLFVFLLSLPFYFIAKASSAEISYFDSLLFFVLGFALIAETVADNQLHQFKKNNKKGVCNIGLWQYSRHPNYFFEWLIWLSFALFPLFDSYGYLALISPLTLYLIMTKITIPMTEENSISSRGQKFIDYQNKTPIFFPSILRLLLWIVAFQLMGGLMGIMTSQNLSLWYQSLPKSSLTPPDFVFGITWSLLYLLLACVGWALSREPKNKQTSLIMWLFITQMLLNWLWTPLFFGFHWIGIALLDLLTLTMMNGFLWRLLYRVRPILSLVLVPYIFWLGFACYLNAYIWVKTATSL